MAAVKSFRIRAWGSQSYKDLDYDSDTDDRAELLERYPCVSISLQRTMTVEDVLRVLAAAQAKRQAEADLPTNQPSSVATPPDRDPGHEPFPSYVQQMWDCTCPSGSDHKCYHPTCPRKRKAL